MATAHRRGSSGHPLLTGVSIGLLLGLALALAVAVYLYRANPFTDPEPATLQKPAKSEKPRPPPAGMPTGELPPQPAPGRAVSQQPGHDPLDMLPHAGMERPGREAPSALSRPVYFLQAGSFQSAGDADNLKAQLALWGLEATIVTANVGDKGVWHRVRLGPFTDQGSLQGARTLLRENRIESTVVTVTEEQLRKSAQGASRP